MKRQYFEFINRPAPDWPRQNTDDSSPLYASQSGFDHTQNRKRCENLLNLVSTTSTSIWENHMGRWFICRCFLVTPLDCSSRHGNDRIKEHDRVLEILYT
ncbi:hypothetical protein V6Z96_005723 [Aspergillus fumigatus]